jgi:hypothetical protein
MKLIFTILLIILLSCTKEDYCWQCVYTEYDKINDYTTIVTIDTFPMCYKTEDWINDFQRNYSRSICDDSTRLICSKIE